MTAPAVYWPVLLGILFLVAGMIRYRPSADAPVSRGALGLVRFGPVFVAASLAAFAGEHFTAGPSLAAIVPKWLPAPLFIAYFVGVAHLAAASSFAARRCVRWAAFFLALMFALFVLLMDLPGAMSHPGIRIDWSLAAREATFSIGALALFATETSGQWPVAAARLATVAKIWTAGVLVFYGIENILYPQYWPGVPDVISTATWVPTATVVAFATGLLLIGCGVAMFVDRYAAGAAATAGLVMVLLTLALYVPQFFVARDVPQHVLALNFVFDTLLFGGTMLVIGRAIMETTAVTVEAPKQVVLTSP